MSLVRFDEATYLAKLNRLQPTLRAAFAAASTERLLTGVAPILEPTRPREFQTFRATLDKVWRALDGEALNKEEAAADLKRCEALIPDLDREPYAPELVQLDDGGGATYYTLRALLTGDSADATRVARRAYAMLDSYVTDDLGVHWDGPQGLDAVLGHPVIQAELRRQQRDLEELAAIAAGPHDARAVATVLRERAKQEGGDLYAPQSS